MYIPVNIIILRISLIDKNCKISSCLVGLFLKQNKKWIPIKTILEADSMEFFTLEKSASSACIFSMANLLRVDI